MKVLYCRDEFPPHLDHFAIVHEDGRADILDIYNKRIEDPIEAHSKIKKGLKLTHKKNLSGEDICIKRVSDNYLASRIRKNQTVPNYSELKFDSSFGSLRELSAEELIENSIMTNTMSSVFEEITGESLESYLESKFVWEGMESPEYNHEPVLRELQRFVSETIGLL